GGFGRGGRQRSADETRLTHRVREREARELLASRVADRRGGADTRWRIRGRTQLAERRARAGAPRGQRAARRAPPHARDGRHDAPAAGLRDRPPAGRDLEPSARTPERSGADDAARYAASRSER